MEIPPKVKRVASIVDIGAHAGDQRTDGPQRKYDPVGEFSLISRREGTTEGDDRDDVYVLIVPSRGFFHSVACSVICSPLKGPA